MEEIVPCSEPPDSVLPRGPARRYRVWADRMGGDARESEIKP